MATTLVDPADGDPPHIVVRLVELDAFVRQIDELAAGTSLILYMTDLPFVDSDGLGVIIRAIRHVRDGGGRTVAVTDKAPLARLLAATGIAVIVGTAETAETYAEALEILREPDTRN